MGLDKYINSHTFKTGVFVIVVLLLFLFVFKLGVVHGHKKAVHSERYNNNFDYIHRSTSLGQHVGAFNKDMYKKLLLKRNFIKNETGLDLKTDNGSGTIDVAQ